ncbi:HipA family kinase, partial [Streptomyces sp. SPB074]|uniref:HipA family kinase n=1 Tax=Streptomyces sp. (strain SPB074) TaxID=465543 RepID=UPI00099875E7
MLTEAAVTRYLAPLREGGSLPGLVEAGDGELYVLKFSGAGQGRKTLVAETVCGLLAARLGLRVPALRALDLDPVIGLGEPDEQVQGLLKGSGGLNLGMGYLAGALGFDPLAYAVEPREAGRVLWFDALVGNVDRSWRNPNLLVHAGALWLIDHGATMIWQHNWPTAAASALRRYDARDHVLAPFAPDLASAEAELAPLVTEELLTGVLAEVPAVWLEGERGFTSADEVRRAYVDALLRRADGLSARVDLPDEPPAPPVAASGWRAPGEGGPAPVP